MGQQDTQTFLFILFPAFRQIVTCFSTSGAGIPTVDTDWYLQWRNWSCSWGKFEDHLLTNLNYCVIASPVVHGMGPFSYYTPTVLRSDPCERRSGSLGEPRRVSNVDLELDPVRCIYGCSCMPCTIEKIMWTSLPALPRYIRFIGKPSEKVYSSVCCPTPNGPTIHPSGNRQRGATIWDHCWTVMG